MLCTAGWSNYLLYRNDVCCDDKKTPTYVVSVHIYCFINMVVIHKTREIEFRWRNLGALLRGRVLWMTEETGSSQLYENHHESRFTLHTLSWIDSRRHECTCMYYIRPFCNTQASIQCYFSRNMYTLYYLFYRIRKISTWRSVEIFVNTVYMISYSIFFQFKLLTW